MNSHPLSSSSFDHADSEGSGIIISSLSDKFSAKKKEDDDDDDEEVMEEADEHEAQALDFVLFPVSNDLSYDLCDFRIPRGYKFSPRDRDLIQHYLVNKIFGHSLPCNTIKHIDLYKYDPMELPIGKSKHFLRNEIYYFTYNEASYSTLLCTKTGYWKVEGDDKEIWQEYYVIGFRRTYLFYRGKDCEVQRTNWIMHEYKINPHIFSQCATTNLVRIQMRRLVACKIIYERRVE